MNKQRVGRFENKTPKKNSHKKLFIRIGANIILLATVATAPAMLYGNKLNEKHKAEIAEIRASHDIEIENIVGDYEARIALINQTHEYGTTVDIIEEEADYISKVIYGMAKDHNINDQRAVIWAIINRVESSGYPDTVKAVCQQPKQWIGYDDENPVLSSIYDTVMTELKLWHNDNRRPMDKSFVFLSWSSKEILLRDTFTVTKSTRYWKMY